MVVGGGGVAGTASLRGGGDYHLSSRPRRRAAGAGAAIQHPAAGCVNRVLGRWEGPVRRPYAPEPAAVRKRADGIAFQPDQIKPAGRRKRPKITNH
jgi:hypothetical protein